MEQDGIIAFRQYVESLAKTQSIKTYMGEQTDINILQAYHEIHVSNLNTLKAIAKEYGKKIIYADTTLDENLYKYYASFQIRSKEHGILLTVFCYTDEGDES